MGGESGSAWRGSGRPSAALERGVGGLIFAGVLVAAALLVVAEFTTLYHVHLATRLPPVESVTVGSHNSYSMIPVAAVAVVLGVAVWRTGSRLVLLAIGLLGLVALLITLLHDLPDAHAHGLAYHNSVSATTTPGPGLYMETLGSILLIATCGLGFLMIGWPRGERGAQAGPAEGG